MTMRATTSTQMVSTQKPVNGRKASKKLVPHGRSSMQKPLSVGMRTRLRSPKLKRRMPKLAKLLETTPPKLRQQKKADRWLPMKRFRPSARSSLAASDRQPALTATAKGVVHQPVGYPFVVP